MIHSLEPQGLTSKIEILRDWLACFGSHAQSSALEERVVVPFRKYREGLMERVLYRQPWPHAEEQHRELWRMGDFLGMLGKAIAHPEGRGLIDRAAAGAQPDEYGTPSRLILAARYLRTKQRKVPTFELLGEGIDMGRLLAPSKGCTPEVREWADLHIRAGKGWWKWTPPTLPSPVTSGKEGTAVSAP